MDESKAGQGPGRRLRTASRETPARALIGTLEDMEPTTSQEPARPVLTAVYDGDCGLCTRVVRMLDRWDDHRKLDFVPSHDPDVRRRYPDVPDEAFRRSIQVFDPTGKRWEEAEAFSQILAVLPGGRPVAALMRAPVIRTVARAAYVWVARNRYRFGSDSCPSPGSGEEP